MIEAADPATGWLSFQNLVELHVLDCIRKGHGVPLQRIRTAIQYLQERLGIEHPLAHVSLLTNGKDLFIERLENLLEVTRPGQLASRDLLESHLKRIEYGEDGRAARLYPFVLRRDRTDPRAVVVDPRIQFGRPCLSGTGIPTAVVAERFHAGESIQDLASDYARSTAEIEAALRFERLRDAA